MKMTVQNNRKHINNSKKINVQQQKKQDTDKQNSDLRASCIHNDPKGNIYFYFNNNKKCICLMNHVDRKTTIDRKATDIDKLRYPGEWAKFNEKRE